MAEAAFVLVGTSVLPKQRRGSVFDFGRIKAKPTTAIKLPSSPKNNSHRVTLASRGANKWEHAETRNDVQQYGSPAIIMRPGGWRIFNNRRTANERRKMAGAVELEFLVETGMEVRMWELSGASKKVCNAATRGRRFPVTGIG